MLVDSHCHLTYEPMVSDIQNVLDLCNKNQVSKILTVGTNLVTSKNSIQIADSHKNIFCTIGLHPNETVKELADKHGVSSAQILISYSVHRDIAVIPKSVNQDRIAQNLASLEISLDESDMEKLKNIGIAYRFIDGSFFTGPQSPFKLTDLWEKE